MNAIPRLAQAISDGKDFAKPAADIHDAQHGKVHLQDVSKVFADGTVAVDRVNLEVEPGEFFTLLGPSGCGKTTLLRIIAGFEDLNGGAIFISGRSMLEVPPHARNVNTVFQSYALFPHLNVAENIAFGLRMRGVKAVERRRRCQEMMVSMQIDVFAKRMPHQLSGGQRQRVALARALINEPEVVLLDEPLSALDAKLRQELQVELLRMQKRLGMTFIFVTHDQHEALVMSDRIAVMDKGLVRQMGRVDDVYERPCNVFVAEFLGLSNIFRVQSMQGTDVSTSLGMLRLSHTPETLQHVMVRPEKVLLSSPEEGGRGINDFQGMVREALYMGATSQYWLEIDGYPLVATISNTQNGRPRWRVGERLRVHIEPASIVGMGG
ncbi:MAG: ABC transporter ATP-binding protein [Acidithiobacillus sp.]